MTSTTSPDAAGQLELIEQDGETLLAIPHVERMPPFLMSVLSSTDLWMFVASNGGLTAGRQSAENSLFPYETSDRLYERPGLGGPLSFVRVNGQLWRPFDPWATDPRIVRRLTKSVLGDRVGFEEVNEALMLGFRYEWFPSEQYGWVRSAKIWTTGAQAVQVEILDGLLDILPAGVPLTTQQRASNLIDAYRHSELHDVPCHLALYSLSSLLTDRAEPAEALRANSVWRTGLPGRTHLSPDTVPAWRRGERVESSAHLRGKKGAYLVEAEATLEPGHPVTWSIVCDVALDGVAMAALRRDMSQDGLGDRLRQSIQQTRVGLAELVASVDGRQLSADRIVAANHLSNALFNGLRGGFVIEEGRIPRDELLSFLRLRNRTVAEHHEGWVAAQPEKIEVESLRRAGRSVGDPDLARLVDETIPLALGRRHGDPSRPWNRFNIRTRTASGERAIHYEGNWRDIFQNWEALAISYPEYLPSMIAKFVNASTVDGFNPYRISRDGIDWEVPDPEDPWSNIGYWGDHQIIYSLRLLEGLHRYRPALLTEMLDAKQFSFGDVPYRICPYVEMLKNPRDTIRFDEQHEERIAERVAQAGNDGRLVWRGPEVALTHLWEKLLVPLLSKLSCLVVDGGIWMNTQRPEWNDANNALPGYGLSVVTLAHTLRYARFLYRLTEERQDPITTAPIVRRWMEGVAAVLSDLARHQTALTPAERRTYLDRLGNLFSEYREAAYAGWSGATMPVSADELRRLLSDASTVLERSFRGNRRPDGLFHSYNTMSIEPDGVHIRHLGVMLEGQVAALDAQVLAPNEVADLIDSMFASPIYREDQNTFLLYPDKTLPDFEARNVVDADKAKAIPSVRAWLEAGDGRIMAADAGGRIYFQADLKNAEVLETRLNELESAPDWTPVTDECRSALLALYEQTFHHAEFTGRSASMYGFEGLGCVYWHMVAKLLVALQESYLRSVGDAAAADVERLAQAYHRVRDGFGFNKTPASYGAFPTDAYSHTPGNSGAQQPGMTGQVKEQVLTRFGELGMVMREGTLTFEPTLLRKRELTTAADDWTFINSSGQTVSVPVPAGGLGFMVAGIPIVYRTGSGPERAHVVHDDGAVHSMDGLQIDAETTQAMMGRRSTVKRIDVDLLASRFRA